MDQALYPVIAGALTLTIGAISFWGRFALPRFGAKAASSVTGTSVMKRHINVAFATGTIQV